MADKPILAFWKLGEPPQEMSQEEWESVYGFPEYWRMPSGTWFSKAFIIVPVDQLPNEIRMWALLS